MHTVADVAIVVITLGARGVFYSASADDDYGLVPAVPVEKVIDTLMIVLVSLPDQLASLLKFGVSVVGNNDVSSKHFLSYTSLRFRQELCSKGETIPLCC